MKERVFLDTNVLVYLFDADDPAKQRRVQALLSDRELRAQLILSTQVLQEFYVSVTRKLGTPLDPEAAFQAVQDLAAFPVVQIDPPLILLAIQRSRKAKVSFWDALILSDPPLLRRFSGRRCLWRTANRESFQVERLTERHG